MDRLGDLSGFDWLNDKTLRFRDPDQDGSAWGQIEDENNNVIAEVDPILMMDVLSRIQWCEAIVAIPDLLAALKESRKEKEKLRERVDKAKAKIDQLIMFYDGEIGTALDSIKGILDGRQ